MEIYAVIQGLLDQVKQVGLIAAEDEVYARNRILDILNVNSFESPVYAVEATIPDLLEMLEDFAVKKGLIKNLLDEKEMFASKIMNVFMPRPSDLNRMFWDRYKSDPQQATTFFYDMSQNSNYIQTKRIAQNISYTVDTAYGELDITINLSKPEKDPKEIALEKEMKSLQATNYPKCLLCVENEGYEGRIGHPARANHRLIRLQLEEEAWFLQYSPYVYYNEHCILLSGAHRDMKINKDTFLRLLAFIKQFPHYFAGSNADLPIVGGSILSHDHYQGGNYEFAMAKAGEELSFTMKDFSAVEAAIIKWPMSVIRLKSTQTAELAEAGAYILDKWISYSDSQVGVKAYSGDTRHNTITPIARYRNGKYELDLVLRNNRTSEEHPLGIFHPHDDVHHIKKENIGLIEVMGLAVLPARLKSELEEVENYLLGKEHDMPDYHLPWAQDIHARYGQDLASEAVHDIVKKEVGLKFLRVLEDAGVFKRDPKGQEAFRKFVYSL
ncbi:UDP-glucose--hexose-1-phosphate uridylyltransferase [Ectobacillus antri]|jgi:UDPglucose--hexose-1-phosphate uridylyltransferase|uniref:Galactose-1-phosphate uridylyltransferase n=1 Tax=Ectobacillus antri TaxID=2486280 RepID=A0ABT6H6A6_9BACI|nr:UDP-glucose--hexose-1-phosphate uridylyltransferase [Ectobacillus antri]MDG4657275.1 UDP-glucose--hexose-1-phosphate uridylyltransferase [Ectobacillus antri]MDG5754373.1 UDP-glucose--hexose-1-phosphate uridylyltransferase [Ectobacillus antri]